MEKEILFIQSNDWHISPQTHQTVERLVKVHVDLCVEHSCPMVVAGDVFDVRGSQRLECLMSFKRILDYITFHKVKAYILHGNHDLPVYENTDSWLTPFNFDQEYITIIDHIKSFKIGEKKVDMMPFQIEDMMIETLNEARGGDILVSHFELNGSVSNGIAATGRAIDKSMLEKWGLVLLGHYHTHGEVTDNIIHCPSLFQRNFGESFEKGYTVVYSDNTYELIQSDFKPFKTLKCDIDTLTPEKVKDVLREAKNDINLRLEVSGATEKLKAFKKEKFNAVGVDVKLNYDEVFLESNTNLPLTEETNTSHNVMESLEKWCESEEIDKTIGEKYLKKVIDG